MKDISTDKLILLLIKIYDAFPETIERNSKLTKEEKLAQQTREYVERLQAIFNGEYESQNQK